MMKCYILSLSSIFLFLNISFSTSAENTKEQIQYANFKNNETQIEKVFNFNESSNNNVTIRRNRQLRSGEVLDCFGLGRKFATLLDSFLKKDANGTDALRVKFFASTRNSPERLTLMHGDKFDLRNIDFDIRRRTFFIVHGFLAHGNKKWIEDMTEALLKWDDVNVFAIDWSDGSFTWNYYKAAVNTRTVGDQIATMIGQLINASTQTNEMDPSSFGPLHLIGHSLGAHICGYAAQEILKRKHKWTVERITGLDPAQPCFKDTDDELRLDRNDAPLVDVIHTNGRMRLKLGLGLPTPMGHVDFYPNGGEVQPGCALASTSLWNLLPLPIESIMNTICSHGRSYLYFTDSIDCAIEKSCTFWSHDWNLSYEDVDSVLSADCSDRKCVEMGINAEKYIHNGTFFTVTGRSRPFCQTNDETKGEIKEMIMGILDEKKQKIDYDSADEVFDEALIISDWT